MKSTMRAHASDIVFPHQTPARLRDYVPTCVFCIDAEEEFDWANPVQGVSHGLDTFRFLPALHDVLFPYGVLPTHLVTYPLLMDDASMRILDQELQLGRCHVGIQNHPWMTPPFPGETTTHRESFATNLPPDLEREKILTLCRVFKERFGSNPSIYRSGRYGVSKHTPYILEHLGFDIDISLAPRTSMEAEGGPNYIHVPYETFWFGVSRKILELPLCREVIGWGGGIGTALYSFWSRPGLSGLHVPSILRGLNLAERVTLSPEGNDAEAANRLIRGLMKRGQRIFTLSFHSSSLGLGGNPYVRDGKSLALFQNRLSAMIETMRDGHGIRFLPVPELLNNLSPPDKE